MAKDKKGFFAEFRDFVMRGNVLDMAVGVVIATSFGKITNTLVNNVIMPLIGMLIGNIDLSKWDIMISPAVVDETGAVVKEAVVIGIGAFLVTIIDFVIIAFAIFLFIKLFNKAKELSEMKLFKKKAEEEEVVEEAPPAPTTEELLADILAELKKNNSEETK